MKKVFLSFYDHRFRPSETAFRALSIIFFASANWQSAGAAHESSNNNAIANARSCVQRASFQSHLGLFSAADDAAFARFMGLSNEKTNAFLSYCLERNGCNHRYRSLFIRDIEPGSYQIDGIDRLTLINLNRRPEKLKASLAELAPYGLVPDRLAAVDGKMLAPGVVSQMGVRYDPRMLCFMATRYRDHSAGKHAGKEVHEIIHPSAQTWLVHCASRMQIGCYLSHLSAIWEAYWSGSHRLWVLEDDIRVVRDPRSITEAIADLEALVGSDGWDMLFTDLDHKNREGHVVACSGYAMRPDLLVQNDVFNRKPVGTQFVRYGSRYGTHSYVLSRAGMEKILAFADVFGMYAPIDLDMCVIPGIRLFGMVHSVIETTSAVHD
jgi:GR25 family glycosyltransferase involved in LPS biosynthesis